MPTPVNNNNNAYVRHYKTLNAFQAEQVRPDELSVKGSIDLPALCLYVPVIREEDNNPAHSSPATAEGINNNEEE